METIETVDMQEPEIKLKEGYKKTKIGWIPEDWGKVILGDICKIYGRIGYRGYTVKDIVNKGEGAISISPSNINGNLLNLNDSTYISWFKYDESPEIKVEVGDILLVKTGSTFGKSTIIKKLPEKATINPQLVIIKEVKESKEFLSYLISDNIIQKQIRRTVVGGAIPTLSQENILNFYIPLPPLREQRKIAEILSTWDVAIEQTQKLLEQLKLRKKGLMQQLLTGKTRLKGFDGEWKYYQIGELAKSDGEINKDNQVQEVLSCTKYDGLVRSLEYFGRKVFGDDLSKYKIVPRGYFAYATNHIEEGSIGYQNLMDFGLVSPMYTVFKTNKKVDDNFFFRLLKTDKMIYYYQSNMSGSIARRGGLRWNVFETIGVKIPSVEEQRAIAKVLTAADDEIKAQETYLEKLQEQKKGLMQNLLTGEIRVNVDNDNN